MGRLRQKKISTLPQGHTVGSDRPGVYIQFYLTPSNIFFMIHIRKQAPKVTYSESSAVALALDPRFSDQWSSTDLYLLLLRGVPMKLQGKQ